MTKSKFLKTAGFTVFAIAMLSVLDFLGARFLAPFSPFYKARAVPKNAAPELPPIDLSKLKISDTKKVLAQREALAKKLKLETKALTENDIMTMVEIGFMYEGTELGNPDIAQAIHWFKKAADTGDEQAIKHLEYLYTQQDK